MQKNQFEECLFFIIIKKIRHLKLEIALVSSKWNVQTRHDEYTQMVTILN